MRELIDSNHSFGFEINTSSYSYAEVLKKRGDITILGVKTARFEDDGKIDPHLVAKADASLIVLGLEAGDCLVRPLHVPVKKDSDVNDALAFQAEPLLPFPLEEAILDWIKIEQDNKGTQATFTAVKKETVARVLKSSEEIGLDPEIISNNGSALAAYAKQFVKTDQPHLVAHIGDERSLFALVHKGKLIASQGSKITLKEIIKAFEAEFKADNQEAIDEAFKNLELKHLDNKYPHLSAALIEARLDMTRNIFGLAKLMKGEPVDEALITGSIARYPNLKAYFLSEVGKQEIHPEISESIALSKEDLACFALPLGLALQGVDTSSQINFRQGPFAYSKPLKRILKPILLYGASCLALSIALFFLGSSYFSYRENTLRQEYVSLLESVNKTYQAGESDFAGVKESPETYEAIDVKKLDIHDIERRLDKLEKEIKEAPDFIALNPNVPRVSDVLAWLTSHPNVGFVLMPTKNEEPMILIENFNYALVKRPEEKKRDLKYQVKVDLEFTSPSPKVAREFHDSLISPNDMVDPKGEIKWSSTRGKYKTSFYLKDKTFYPTQRSF